MQKLAPARRSGGLPQHGLVSLWEMLQQNAAYFSTLIQYLEEVRRSAQGLKSKTGIFTEEYRLQLNSGLVGVREHLDALKMKSAVRHLDRFIVFCKRDFQASELSHRFEELMQRIQDDLEDREIFLLSEEDAVHYSNGVKLFGDEVAEAFPRALPDIEEAGKCLELERFTACCFHLMRALEVPLQVLAKRFVPNDPKPNWDPVLKAIDTELKRGHKERTIKGEVDFYAGVSAHMHAVKLAWRNRVNHIDEIVPPEKAREIFNATRALMRHLAEHLSEPQDESS